MSIIVSEFVQAKLVKLPLVTASLPALNGGFRMEGSPYPEILL